MTLWPLYMHMTMAHYQTMSTATRSHPSVNDLSQDIGN